MIYVNILVLLV